MGIPRLTTDLQPYLENAIVSKEVTPSCSTVKVDKIVIDGPGLVYHVYNKIAACEFDAARQKDTYNPPTYSRLCAGIDTFLTDLEDCGAEIVHIYFDGALPKAKREIRLNRLEKTLQQLVAFRLVHPNLKLDPANQGDEAKSSLSLSTITPWKNETSFNANTGLPQLPFIVAAAREYLSTSKWSSCTSTVPGEADSYCAAAARSAQAAVLTNDSDLVLFEDMQTDGVALLLNSLARDDETSNFSRIRGTCWRPSEIKRKLDLANLLSLAFERTEDSSCSFLTLVKRAKNLSRVPSNAEKFAKFANQFKSDSLRRSSDTPIRKSRFQQLDILDPRLSELTVQLQQTYDVHPQGDLALNMYFPILHEDHKRDSSWSYGRRYRQLAYSTLYHHHISTHHSSQQPNHRNDEIFITEFTRKSHIISRENMRASSSHHRLSETLKQCHDELQALSPPPPPTRRADKSKHHDKHITSRYILFALANVLQQRTSNGKQPPPPRLLAQFLGLSPFPSQQTPPTRTRHHATASDNSNGWSLLHLHANVQAVLYSVRILKQSIDYTVSSNIKIAPDSSSPAAETSTSPAACDDTEIEERISRVQSLLADMPSVAALFLHPMEVAAHFGKLLLPSRHDNNDDSGGLREELMRTFFERTGVDPIALTTTSDRKPSGEGLSASYGAVDTQFQDSREMKRRKRKPEMNVARKTISRAAPGRNMFDVLGEEM